MRSSNPASACSGTRDGGGVGTGDQTADWAEPSAPVPRCAPALSAGQVVVSLDGRVRCSPAASQNPPELGPAAWMTRAEVRKFDREFTVPDVALAPLLKAFKTALADGNRPDASSSSKEGDSPSPYSAEELALAAALRDGLLRNYALRRSRGDGSPSTQDVLRDSGNQAQHWQSFLRVSAPAYLVRSLCTSMMRRARAVRSE